MSKRTGLRLDPGWDEYTAEECRPRSPQAILCGDVVVGHRYEPCGVLPERVIAVGGDHEIQSVLEAFFARWKAEEKRKRDKEVADFFQRSDRERERQVAEAKRALRDHHVQPSDRTTAIDDERFAEVDNRIRLMRKRYPVRMAGT